MPESFCGVDAQGEVDVGVYPNKSTWVDLGTSSRVESVSFGAVDPPSNVKLKSYFTQIDPKHICCVPI